MSFTSTTRPPAWLVVALSGIGVFAVGIAGFESVDAKEHDLLDLAYRSLQLLSAESGDVPEAAPLSLELARFLAPAVALAFAAVVLRAVVELLREERLFGIRPGHVVICGLGRSGGALAAAISEGPEPKRQVVGIALDGANPGAARARNAHARILLENATEDKILKRAQVHRASAVAVLCGNDTTNAEVAAAVKSFVAGGASPQILLGIRDRRLAAELAEALREDPSVVPINLPADAAKRMVQAAPLPSNEPDLHVLIVGFGSLGQAVARELMDGPGRGPMLVTAVYRDVGRKAQAVRIEAGDCAHCDLQSYTGEFVSAEFETLSFLAGKPAVTAVFVCVSDDALAVTVALQLRRAASLRGSRIVVRVSEEDGGLGRLVYDHAKDRKLILSGAHDAAGDLAAHILPSASHTHTRGRARVR